MLFKYVSESQIIQCTHSGGLHLLISPFTWHVPEASLFRYTVGGALTSTSTSTFELKQRQLQLCCLMKSITLLPAECHQPPAQSSKCRKTKRKHENGIPAPAAGGITGGMSFGKRLSHSLHNQAHQPYDY